MSTAGKLQLITGGEWDSRILAFRCGDTVNAFAVLSEQFTVIIDTLYSADLAAEFTEQVLSIAKIRAEAAYGRVPQLLVIVTHADWDHCWGNACFCGTGARFPAPVIASDFCRQRMASAASRQLLDAKKAAEPRRFAEASLELPTQTFSGSLDIHGGDLTLHLASAVGHTHDQIAVWIPEVATLLAADSIEFPLSFPGGCGQISSCIDTLKRFNNLHPKFVLASHDSSLNEAAASWPEKQLNAGSQRIGYFGDRSVLTQNLEYFEQLQYRMAHGHPGFLESVYSRLLSLGAADLANDDFNLESPQAQQIAAEIVGLEVQCSISWRELLPGVAGNAFSSSYRAHLLSIWFTLCELTGHEY